MFVIGLTGGIASGKTHAARYLKALGAAVWDADVASRAVVRAGTPGNAALREAFGPEYFMADGKLDRPRLGRAVFADEEMLKKLNAIIHPLVKQDMLAALDAWRKGDVRIGIVVAPLLLEAGFEAHVDEIWVTSCGADEQLRRLVERDGMTWDEARDRMRAQMSDAQRRQRAQRVIDTSGPIEGTQRFLRALYEEMEEQLCSEA